MCGREGATSVRVAMIARLTTHRSVAVDRQPGQQLLAVQIGFQGGYELVDRLTGECLAVTFWDTRSDLAGATALRGVDQGKRVGLDLTSVRILDVIAVF